MTTRLIIRAVLAVTACLSLATPAYARGGGGGFIGGLLVIALLGFLAFVVYRFLCGDKKWFSLPSDGEQWLGMGAIGLLSIFLGGWIALFCLIAWYTAQGKFPILGSILGLGLFGMLSFFPLRLIGMSIIAERRRNRERDRLSQPASSKQPKR